MQMASLLVQPLLIHRKSHRRELDQPVSLSLFLSPAAALCLCSHLSALLPLSPCVETVNVCLPLDSSWGTGTLMFFSLCRQGLCGILGQNK